MQNTHKKSVTHNDADGHQFGRYFDSAIGRFGSENRQISIDMLPFGHNQSWSPQRDFHLQSTTNYSPQWATAVSMAISKFASHGYELTNKYSNRLNVGNNILKYANGGKGFVSFLNDIGWDYLMTDNGFFIETVRKSPVSNVEQINVLESSRCERTGKREEPVTYTRHDGKRVKLKFWQVIMSEDLRGVPYSRPGKMCAAHMVYDEIYLSAIMKQRTLDIEAASRFSRIVSIPGSNKLGADYIKEVMEDGKEQAKQPDEDRHGSNRGNKAHYDLGTLIMSQGAEVSGSISAVDVISRMSPEQLEAYEMAFDLAFANAVGIGPSELNPKNSTKVGLDSGRAAGRETDQVNSRGLTELVTWLEHQLTHFVLPAESTLTMTRPSLSEQLKEEMLKLERAKRVAIYINSNALTASQGANMLSDAGDIATEFAQPDLTDGGTVDDASGETKEFRAKMLGDDDPVSSQYLKSLERHIDFVVEASQILGVPEAQYLIHDESKFSEVEFMPYAINFYGTEAEKEANKPAFQKAWLHHLHNNPHHWNHWILQNDSDGLEPIDMPFKYVLEMVADWHGAGRAYNNSWDISGWLRDAGDNFVMTDRTVELLRSAMFIAGYVHTSDWNYKIGPDWLFADLEAGITAETKEKKSLSLKGLDFETDSEEFNTLFRLYSDDIQGFADQLAAGEITESEFEEELKLLIAAYFLNAFLIGSEVDTDDDLEESAVVALDNERDDSIGRIAGLALFISGLVQSGKSVDEIKSGIDNRLALWRQKLLGTWNKAKTYNPLNPPLMHVLGGTIDHCSTCVELNGQIRRAFEWRDAGLIPRNAPNDAYECGGWRCDCSFRRVSEEEFNESNATN